MISEQGPKGHLPEDEAPTEIFGPIRTRERRTVKLTAVLAAAILIVLVVAGYEVTTRLGRSVAPAGRPVAVAAHTPAAVVASTPAAATPSASPSASPSPSPSPSATPPARVLAPVSASAVGPDGASGDDPVAAGYVIGRGSSTGWETDWYTTAEFGGLQTGTGLIIDMGHSVTIGKVTLTLGGIPGTDFEVLAGNTSTMSHMSRLAAQSDASGTVELTLTKPAQARYLLVWLTKLPPDGEGHYMGRIYHITVTS
ncbi:MAG TPA: hypothetical protein VN969_12760 [Streptosporangiaceae bacterium]|jgi:hypothetical protein|nr:hypothetical protein [Streptosporangiaceae bacterium]